MKVIEIKGQTFGNLVEHIEKALRHAGNAMQELDDLKREHGMNERSPRHDGRYGNCDGYGEREHDRPYYRDEDNDWDDDMGERRRSLVTGRYMR